MWFEIKNITYRNGFVGDDRRWFLFKAYPFTLVWNYPHSSVWIISSLSIGIGRWRKRLWERKYAPVKPKSATGEISDKDRREIQKEWEESNLEAQESGNFPNPKAPWVQWFNRGCPIRPFPFRPWNDFRRVNEWTERLKKYEKES